MGIDNQPTSYLSSLPPGSRFYPSDEQLLSFYLSSKNSNNLDKLSTNSSGIDVIQEINLYNFDPFDLPETSCFRFGRGGRRRHWYCYVAARVLGRSGKRRKAGCGYWKEVSRVRDVVGGGGAGKAVVGTRKTFVFYVVDGAKGGSAAPVAAAAARTAWFMYEYALVDHPKASFVLCRVFVRSPRGINLSEHVLSSYAEESVATVRHIGVQYDGTVTLPSADVKQHDGSSADCDNEGLKFPMGPTNKLDDCITSQPIAEQQMQSHGHVTSNIAVIDALTTEELRAIEEEDFIELDDLVGPLPGIG